MSSIKNAPVTPNDGGFEKHAATHPRAPVDRTAGTNTAMPAYAFEQRVNQEQGTH